MYRQQKDLEKVDWVKIHFFIKKNDLTGPASGVRGNTLRLRRKTFKSRLRNNFSQHVTVRNSFFLIRVVSIWNSFSDYVVTSSTLNNAFKSAPDRSIWNKERGCCSSKGIGFLILEAYQHG